jgi:hypothetical protein
VQVQLTPERGGYTGTFGTEPSYWTIEEPKTFDITYAKTFTTPIGKKTIESNQFILSQPKQVTPADIMTPRGIYTKVATEQIIGISYPDKILFTGTTNLWQPAGTGTYAYTPSFLSGGKTGYPTTGGLYEATTSVQASQSSKTIPPTESATVSAEIQESLMDVTSAQVALSTQTTRTSTIMPQQEKTVSISQTSVRPISASISKTLTKTIPVQTAKSLITPQQVQVEVTAQLQQPARTTQIALKQVPLEKTYALARTSSLTSPPSPPKLGPPLKPIPIPSFSLKDIPVIKIPKYDKRKRGYKYTSSLIAREFGYTTTKKPPKFFSGTELRPILTTKKQKKPKSIKIPNVFELPLKKKKKRKK